MTCHYSDELEIVHIVQLFWDFGLLSLVISKTVRLTGKVRVQTLPNLRNFKFCSFRLTHFNRSKKIKN